tara:strand:+ start:2330 stop:3559 length:1230 start_codon:yes stop_codon:yes gene_type:complete
MSEAKISDVIVLGAGPAALCIASELVQQELDVLAIASKSPKTPWPNTYGIWAKELESLGLESLLSHRWSNTVSFFGDGINPKGKQETLHHYDYGLFDQKLFQDLLLKRCGDLNWLIDTAEGIRLNNSRTEVICGSGNCYQARIVIDASGHRTKFIERPKINELAEQAAYGVVGKFTLPPVKKNQFVLMDFRPDHLNENQLKEPPSFLYAMDLGENNFFVEETSLACFPPLSFEMLKDRLYSRLSKRNIEVKEILHEEKCLFPMNLPLPNKNQFILGFGASASMVHPASGYMVGSLLRRAPLLARNLAINIKRYPHLNSFELAKKGWRILWPFELTQRHKLYQYGLNRLMSFDENKLRSFFMAFFKLPTKDWSGFLANTLPLHRLIIVMIRMFFLSPTPVKIGMISLWKL